MKLSGRPSARILPSRSASAACGRSADVELGDRGGMPHQRAVAEDRGGARQGTRRRREPRQPSAHGRDDAGRRRASTRSTSARPGIAPKTQTSSPKNNGLPAGHDRRQARQSCVRGIRHRRAHHSRRRVGTERPQPQRRDLQQADDGLGARLARGTRGRQQQNRHPVQPAGEIRQEAQ